NLSIALSNCKLFCSIEATTTLTHRVTVNPDLAADLMLTDILFEQGDHRYSFFWFQNVHPFWLPCMYSSSNTWEFKRSVAFCPNFPIFSSYIRFLESSGGGF
ncbi:hypothetical protein, partial [Desulfobacula sp.]|uniref:hypothetical protein n=1 Tax=Desulfobacula sp. TaxID=2593537 RepID=UPI0039B858DD